MFEPDLLEQAHPSKIVVSKGALIDNFKAIKEFVTPSKIMAVLKADAYGYGIIEVAKELVNHGVDYIGVAFLSEGITLRQAGINTPIQVLGGLSGAHVKGFLDYDLDFTASSTFKLEAIAQEALKQKKVAKVHLKIDTGMGRIGVQHDRIAKFFEEALSFTGTNLKIEPKGVDCLYA